MTTFSWDRAIRELENRRQRRRVCRKWLSACGGRQRYMHRDEGGRSSPLLAFDSGGITQCVMLVPSMPFKGNKGPPT
ncbi:hypothetical protein ACS0PU_006807 [Formica fusca]